MAIQSTIVASRQSMTRRERPCFLQFLYIY